MSKEQISEVMRALGQRTSEAKKKAASENGRATRFQAKPIEDFECRCGKCPDDPKTYCPRGRAIIRRRVQEAAQQQAPQS